MVNVSRTPDKDLLHEIINFNYRFKEDLNVLVKGIKIENPCEDLMFQSLLRWFVGLEFVLTNLPFEPRELK